MSKKLRILAIAAAAAVFFSVLFSGCAADPSGLKYLDKEVVIKGLDEIEFSVSIEDLIQMPSVNEAVEGLRSNGDVVKFTAVGPTLDTLLAYYGKTKDDFSSVRFSATDGYSVIIPKELLERREIVLAYMNGRKALDKYNSPLRVIVVGERAMYWARMVSEIEFFTGDEEDNPVDKIVFFDTALPMMDSEYSEEEGGDIVSTINLLSKYGGLSDGGKVYMSAYDGLKKNEMMENFLKGYIKYTGEKTPQFCSPELPEGMNMDGIVSIRTDGSTAYFSLACGAEVLPAREGDGDGRSGIGVMDLLKELGVVNANAYRIESVDGGYELFGWMDLSKGVFAEEDGVWSYFGPDDRTVKNVLLVEAIAEPQQEQGEQ